MLVLVILDASHVPGKQGDMDCGRQHRHGRERVGPAAVFQFQARRVPVPELM